MDRCRGCFYFYGHGLENNTEETGSLRDKRNIAENSKPLFLLKYNDFGQVVPGTVT
jgi:hypothetical protein